MAMAAPAISGSKMNYSRRRLGDDDIQRLRRELPLQRDNLPFDEVDFSQNELTSRGLAVVLEVCRKCPKLRVLKLYKNQIDDGGAKGLADLCGKCQAIEEIHLSHNHFTATGAETLITAAEQTRPDNMSPLWLRLEQNDISGADDLFRELEKRELRVCSRQDEYRCTVRSCYKKMKIHLPFFDMQRAGRYNRDRPGQPSFRVPDNAETVGPSFRVPRGEGASPSVSIRSGATPKGAASVSGGSVWGSSGGQRFAGAASPVTDDGSGTPSRAKSPSVWGNPAAGNFAASNGSGNRADGAIPPGQPAITRSVSGGTSGGAPAPPPAPSSIARAVTAPAGAVASPKAAAASPKVAAASPKAAASPAPKAAAAPASKLVTSNNTAGAATTSKPAATNNNVGSSAGQAQRVETPQAQSPEPATATPTPSATAAPEAVSTSTSGGRASVVLDSHGRRRIHPKQLEAEEQSNQFVCPLCKFVIIRPVMTSCSHLFCDTCFRNWVAGQVEKQKKESPDGQAVPLIPCPQPRCTAKLRKKDIMPLDKAESSKVGAVQLLQRLRNNLVVRCVHHTDHFKHPFGRDAEQVQRERGLTCTWVGDLMAYEEHICKGCEIERYLGGAGGDSNQASSQAASPKAASQADSGATFAAQAPPPPPKAGASKTTTTAARDNSNSNSNGNTASTATSPTTATDANAGSTQSNAGAQKAAAQEPAAAQQETNPTDMSQVRMARYDYTPRDSDQAQIVLKAHDLVKIFEVTEWGWAAGVRLCKDTMQEIGEAGWFPAGYLYPPDHVIAK